MARAALLWSVILCSGCLRAGFDARQPTDATSSDAPAAASDASAAADGGGSWSRSCVRDGGCIECDPISSSTSCPAVCPSGDCDALLQARDPWPARCNALLLGQDFARLDAKTWGRGYAGQHVQIRPCGALDFATPRGNFSVWAWIRTGVQIGARQLVEILVRFDPSVVHAELWLDANALPADDRYSNVTQRRTCGIELDRDEISLAARVIDGKAETNSGAALSGAARGAIVLQSWVQAGQHRCRAVTSAGRSSTLSLASSLQGGTIRLLAVNATANGSPASEVASVDYLRVYQAP